MSKDVAIGMVSHHLHEVLSTADTVSVLRDGNLVSTSPVGEEDEGSLIQKMVGRSLRQMYVPKHRPLPDAEVVLEASDIWRDDVVRGVSLSVKAGEIVGLAGLVGAGTLGVRPLRDRGRPLRPRYRPGRRGVCIAPAQSPGGECCGRCHGP